MSTKMKCYDCDGHGYMIEIFEHGEFPSEIISLKIVNDVLVVGCIDGVSHIVSKERFELLNVREKP